MTLHDYIKNWIDRGKVSTSMTKSEFVSTCKGFGISGTVCQEFTDMLNAGGADLTLEGKSINGQRQMLFRGSWAKLYEYMKTEFEISDEQITFW